MSSYSAIYYFMIGNYNTHKPIGYYINNNLVNDNFDTVKFTCDNIFQNSSEEISKNKKNKAFFDYYLIFYTIRPSGTFYLAVVLKNSLYEKEENLIFELFEDIDHQGIKKLANNDGVLTRVGNQNLKFCIELYQENHRKKNNNIINDFNFKNKEKDSSKISLLNNEINDIQIAMKDGVKNMIVNVSDMEQLNDKSSKIKDSSFQFQKASIVLEENISYRKIICKIVTYAILGIIFLIMIYILFQ